MWEDSLKLCKSFPYSGKRHADNGFHDIMFHRPCAWMGTVMKDMAKQRTAHAKDVLHWYILLVQCVQMWQPSTVLSCRANAWSVQLVTLLQMTTLLVCVSNHKFQY